MLGRPSKATRRIWRRTIRGFGVGKHNQRPPLLGCEAELFPCKQKYHYYCNKNYKVIRVATDTDQATTSNAETEEFVRPALWNKPSVRNAAFAMAGAAACAFLPATRVMHLTAFSFWFGTNVWTTFIAGITMFKSLPRQQFGKLQANLFPKYFQVGTACSALLLFTAPRLNYSLWPIAASLACTLANQVYCEPASTEVMFERYRRQNEGIKDKEEDAALKKRFSKLHGLSSLLNLVALVGLVVHMFSLCVAV